MEERRFGRIQIFRRFWRSILPEDAARKADHAASGICYRKHDAVAKLIQRASVAFLADTSIDYLFSENPFFLRKSLASVQPAPANPKRNSLIVCSCNPHPCKYFLASSDSLPW